MGRRFHHKHHSHDKYRTPWYKSFWVGAVVFCLLFATWWLAAENTKKWPLASSLQVEAREAFNFINQERREAGIPEIVWSEELERIALQHSEYMAATDNLEHSHLGYGENIAKGVDGGELIYELWRDSGAHHENYMRQWYKKGAIAIAVKRWSIEVFGLTIYYATDVPYATLEMTSRDI